MGQCTRRGAAGGRKPPAGCAQRRGQDARGERPTAPRPARCHGEGGQEARPTGVGPAWASRSEPAGPAGEWHWRAEGGGGGGGTRGRRRAGPCRSPPPQGPGGLRQGGEEPTPRPAGDPEPPQRRRGVRAGSPHEPAGEGRAQRGQEARAGQRRAWTARRTTAHARGGREGVPPPTAPEAGRERRSITRRTPHGWAKPRGA